MNFIALESEQKLRGGFYTDPEIGAFLAAWLRDGRPERLLEPACGDGALLAAVEQAGIASLREVVACELEPAEAAKAAARTRLPLRVESTDFLEWYLTIGRTGPPFDAVLGNPPFIRYQYLPEEQHLLAERIFAELGLRFTRHTNAWVPFVLASLRLLRAGGRLAMVVPAEILHIPHAAALRRSLAEQCARVLILDPEELWFASTLQGTVLLLAEKKVSPEVPGEGVAVTAADGRATLAQPAEDLFRTASFSSGEAIQGKWMAVLLSRAERELLAELRARPDVSRFSEVAAVDVGIVTGANQFFLVPDETVERFELHRFAFPMFGRSEHVRGLVYTERDHAENRAAGRAAHFLWITEEDASALPAGVRRYLDLGREQGLPLRFKCRTRRPWYRVPSVSAAPIAMLKRAHDFPRLVRNQAGAFTTDTAYRIRPRDTDGAALVAGFVNSLTCLSAELEGRHYGGGVLELVPSEIERLLVPVVDGSAVSLDEADARYRSSAGAVDFLRWNDARVLGQLGLAASRQALLHEAWFRLRNRRQRRSTGRGRPEATR